MEIDHRSKQDILIVDIPDSTGRLTSGDIDDFIRSVISIIGQSHTKVALDLSELSYLNSFGLGDLVKLKDRLLDRNNEMILINPSARVRSLLDMAGVDRFFNIVDGEEDLV